LRIVFVRRPEAKFASQATLMPANVDKTMAAPVTAIMRYDTKFYEQLPRLFRHADAKAWFVGNDAFANDTAYRTGRSRSPLIHSRLRAVGLDAGPMTGLTMLALDAEFFPGGQIKSNVLINIGYGDTAKLFPRSPRLAHGEIATTI